MNVELALVGQVYLVLMVVNVIVAGMAGWAARRHGRLPALAAACALLLGLLPPLNVLYLAVFSLLPAADAP
jgi:hypothetical protein